MNYGIICVLFVVVMPAVFAKIDYCNANLCRNGKIHVACEFNGDFAKTCVNPQIVEMTPELKDKIVNKHNLMRNLVAEGKVGRFPQAERMATMVWDDELAELAELNVKQCDMKHDQCRNTKKFPYSGQNLAISSWFGMNLSVPEVVESDIDAWFDENKDCPLYIVKKYIQTNGKPIGHFTAMVQEKSTHVGCAILRSIVGGSDIQQVFACNYAFTNILNWPVYSQGPTASKCITGINKLYPALCSIKEKY